MRLQLFPNDSGFNIWLSANDTYDFGRTWPCFGLRGKRVFAQFDKGGLCDISINGRDGDCDSHELDSIIWTLAGKRLKTFEYLFSHVA